MIVIIHGDDIEASNKYLSSLIAKKTFQKLTDENSVEDFYLLVFGVSIFENPEVIICTNFLKTKKISLSELEKIPNERNIIFWEDSTLEAGMGLKSQRLAKIQFFKKRSQIYDFLDYLSPKATDCLKLLSNLEKKEDYPLIWQVSTRVLLLIIYKLGISKEKAEKINKRAILDWQWNKISNQAKKFELNTLVNLYGGLAKADFMIKSGKTNLEEKNLFVPLFLKYLNS